VVVNMRIKKSKKEVLSIVKSEGKKGIRIDSIVKQTGWKTRTVNNALRSLRVDGLVKRMPDLMDMRKCIYYGG
jgi:DNA-binding MarR family transcriptional regulator